MKILIVVYHPVGGIRTYFRDVYNQAVFDRCVFTILTPENSLTDLKECIFKNNNIEYITFKKPIDLIRKVRRLLRNNKFNLVHSHGFTAGLSIAIPSYFQGIPHLMTAHDIFQDNQFQGYLGVIKRYFIGIGLKLIDCNMAVSDEAKDNIQRYFPFLKNSRKLIAIKNGINVQRFSRKVKRDLHSELSLSNECILFGFFGRFMKQKGFRLLVDAVADITASKSMLDFRIITFGWGGFIREEQEYIRDIGLEDKFIFMPHTDDMPAAIQGVNAVIMPSLWEACPLLPMEVMVSGIPLISSDCIGLNEVTTNSPAISFTYGDANTLKSAMIDFIDNIPLYYKRAFEFKNQAYVRYDVYHSAKSLHKQYTRMIKCINNA